MKNAKNAKRAMFNTGAPGILWHLSFLAFSGIYHSWH
jgi:hypothetical protein